MNYIKYGHISPLWDSSFKSFMYTRQNIKDDEISAWRSIGYTHNTFTGAMYDSKNPMPEWVNIVSDKLGFTNVGFVFYRMSTLEIMPPHIDHFETYCKVFNIERSNVYRALVMLEDWQPGHYLEIDKKGIVNWISGDYYIWSADVEHAASNIGVEDRYTLQITGTLI